MKSLRIFFALLALLLVVALFIVISLQLLIDPNKLKPIMISEIKKQTGYELTIDGNLSWSFYPLFSVKIDRMSLAEPNQKNVFLELNKVNLGTPLGKIIFHSFRLHDFAGYLNVDDLKFKGIHVRKATLRFLFTDRTLTLLPIYANFYGGILRAEIYGSELTSQAKWKGKIDLSNVQLQPLLIDLKAMQKVNIEGVATINFAGSTQGRVNTQLIQNLNGSMAFKVSQGRLLGIDLNYLLQSAQALIKRESLPATPASPSTPFTDIQGVALFKQGIVTLQNAGITSTTFKASTTGTIDLTKQDLDLRLLIKPIDTVNIPWQIPAIIKGNIQHPNLSLDMDEINKMIVKIGIEKITEKAKEGVENKISDQAQDLLQKLLG